MVSANGLTDVSGRYQLDDGNRNMSLVVQTLSNGVIKVSISGAGMASASMTGVAWTCDFSGTGQRQNNVVKAYSAYDKERQRPLKLTFSENGVEASGDNLQYYCGINGSLEGEYHKTVTYVGGGFTVTIIGTGWNAQYRGCNSRDQCLSLNKPAHYSKGYYIWKNGQYQYMMKPMGSTIYQLSVLNPKGKRIVRKTLKQAK
jgi:hypothetical protein